MLKDIQQKILDSLLLPLMDNFEMVGHDHWITFNCLVEESEALREFTAYHVAKGWLKQGLGCYRLTNEGYLEHLPRARFLRARL